MSNPLFEQFNAVETDIKVKFEILGHKFSLNKGKGLARRRRNAGLVASVLDDPLKLTEESVERVIQSLLDSVMVESSQPYLLTQDNYDTFLDSLPAEDQIEMSIQLPQGVVLFTLGKSLMTDLQEASTLEKSEEVSEEKEKSTKQQKLTPSTSSKPAQQ